jgi:hypothetical protein
MLINIMAIFVFISKSIITIPLGDTYGRQVVLQNSRKELKKRPLPYKEESVYKNRVFKYNQVVSCRCLIISAVSRVNCV